MRFESEYEASSVGVVGNVASRKASKARETAESSVRKRARERESTREGREERTQLDNDLRDTAQLLYKLSTFSGKIKSKKHKLKASKGEYGSKYEQNKKESGRVRRKEGSGEWGRANVQLPVVLVFERGRETRAVENGREKES
jgi:hypothetical protein